jgi:hypothetical protein
MKRINACLFCVLISAIRVSGQAASTSLREPSKELYLVETVRAAPGHLDPLLKAYMQVAEIGPNGQHASRLIFRHLVGDDWDFLVITPLGEKTTIDIGPNPAGIERFVSALRTARWSHSDTFAIGPSVAAVQSALGQTIEGSSDIYTVSDFFALPGRRQDLRDSLIKINATGRSGRTVLLDHVEGASWDFVNITRYDSWSDYATQMQTHLGSRQERQDSVDRNALVLREEMSVHHDTIVERLH